MFSVEYRPASNVLMVRNLARFQRFFEATIDYRQRGDIPGMLLSGRLADALHNVPGMLWHRDSHALWSSEEIDAWPEKFSTTLPRKTFSEHHIADSIRICAATDAASTLKLRDDLTDIDLAPIPELREYLSQLYHACLVIRGIKNYEDRSPLPWRNGKWEWSKNTEMAEEQATFNEILASILLPIPRALVHWNNFDEEQFRRDAIRIGERLPDGNRIEEWINYIHRDGETESVD